MAETVDVNLLDVISSIERAGKCYLESHGQADQQCLMVEDPELAGVYLEAADRAKEFFDRGQHPDLRKYNKDFFDTGYEALKNGEIIVCVQG